MTEHAAPHDSTGHEEHSHGGLGKYIAVFAALCFLTTMSFFTYSEAWPWRDQPEVGWAFMMAVSCTKAMLVVLFFMHVWWEANWKYGCETEWCPRSGPSTWPAPPTCSFSKKPAPQAPPPRPTEPGLPPIEAPRREPAGRRAVGRSRPPEAR
jgi:cytochrome c oxidase subunit IV